MTAKRLPPLQYHLYTEMRRLADTLHTFATECRAEGNTDAALKCYEEARALADVCARLEKAPSGRTLPGAQDTLLGISHRFALSEAKRRQHQDTITLPRPSAPNGAGRPTEEETHDDE